MFRESLLQSSQWEVFQEKNGHAPMRVGDGFALLEALPVVGKYLYFPRFPLSGSSLKKDEVLLIAHGKKAHWLRVEPENETVFETLKKEFGETSIVTAPHDIQPREILVMDITPTEETLLSEMKQKTRYNIRLAEKHGVTVRFSREAKDMETFIELIYATTNRKAIWPHPKNYYRNFFEVFREQECVLALAEHGGKVLTANLLVFFEGVAYYLHGGSSDEGRHMMAPFLLQFESIREAKKRGCMTYNFGGVKTDITGKNSWAGITRFKQGFAPKTAPVVFPGTYDIILSPWWYRLYRLIRSAQKIKNLFRS